MNHQLRSVIHMRLNRSQQREEMLTRVAIGVACGTLLLLLYVLTIREM